VEPEHVEIDTGGRMTADAIVRGLQAKRSGSTWMAKCPAHDDRNPSLAIRESQGKILLHCHAGCKQRDVIEALKARGLWQSEKCDHVRRIVATYDYCNQYGELLYQVVRYAPKDFVQRHPNGRGGWIWKKSPQADSGLLSPELAAGIRRVKGPKKLGVRFGHWLTCEEARCLWRSPDQNAFPAHHCVGPGLLRGRRGHRHRE
jgi:CHC2 zinc finger